MELLLNKIQPCFFDFRAVEPWRFCYYGVSEESNKGCRIKFGISYSPTLGSLNFCLSDMVKYHIKKSKVKLSRNRPWRPIGL
jgi:hypothetical protein